MRAIAKKLRRDDGQALVELAFVIPILLLFLFGIIDFGLALNNQNADNNGANFAVREASVIGTASTATCTTSTSAITTYSTLGSWAACEMSGDGVPSPSVCVYDATVGIPASSSATQTYTIGDTIKVEVTSVFHWASILTGNSGTNLGKSVASPQTTLGGSAELRLEDSFSASATAGTNSFMSPSCTS